MLFHEFSFIYFPFDCRVSSSGFIIPLHKFLKSLDLSYLVGTRFRMRVESDETTERRFFPDCAAVTGIIRLQRIS